MSDLSDVVAELIQQNLKTINCERIRSALLDTYASVDEIRDTIQLLQSQDWLRLVNERDELRSVAHESRQNSMTSCDRCKSLNKRRELFRSKYENYGLYCAMCLEIVDALHEPPCLVCGKTVIVAKRSLKNVVCTVCGQNFDGERFVYFEKLRVQAHNTRARKMGLEANLTLNEWLDTLRRFNLKCAYCKGPYEVLEHYVPLSQGGGTTSDNCVPSCNKCNVTKSGKHPENSTIRLSIDTALKSTYANAALL